MQLPPELIEHEQRFRDLLKAAGLTQEEFLQLLEQVAALGKTEQANFISRLEKSKEIKALIAELALSPSVCLRTPHTK